MEPALKRRTSSVWEHFNLVSPKKVKCLLCFKELGYSSNTSSMLRHYRALHENQDNRGEPSTANLHGQVEPALKRWTSPIWEHFELISPNKVKCLLCFKELGYCSNTSSMLRHYRALHEKKDNRGEPRSGETNTIDEALVDMLIKDTQPYSIVEDQGFRKLVEALNPNYVLPRRKALKAMVEARHKVTMEKAKTCLQQTSAVSITCNMWTSINTDACLAITCHFVDDSSHLDSVVLGVLHLPQDHTAENLATVITSLLTEWGITNKVTCLVTDGAANMGACARDLHLHHSICVAHTLNLMVKKALDQTPVLGDIRAKIRKIVAYFRSSTTAKLSF
ncbi:E3 SUMO-protein ligase ZBED1-like [Pholidichthys leucotaenia]